MPLIRQNASQETKAAGPLGLNYRFGLIPLPLFALLALTIIALTMGHAISQEVSTMIAVLAVGGFACAWIGGLVPWIKRIGGPALVASFLPSYLVYRHWLPQNLVDSISSFTSTTHFIYLYITAVIVGSIFSMNRSLLLKGILKIFVPVLAGSAAALVLGTFGGLIAGMKPSSALFMVVVPVMAGGVGEGAIPLSVGYAEIGHLDPGVLLAQLLPVVLFGNFVAIIFAGVLNTLGKRYPQLTGNGNLQPAATSSAPHFPTLADNASQPAPAQNGQLDIEPVFTAGLFAISLYLLGVLSHRFLSLPAPVTMLVLAVLLKLVNVVPAHIEMAASVVSRFFALAVTYPLLFAVAVSLTPWSSIIAALHPGNLLVITLAVSSLILTGFFVGKPIGFFPIETALVNACHSGAGGTGSVAILTAAERMELLPFAQIATRIGGAITVTLALLALRFLGHL